MENEIFKFPNKLFKDKKAINDISIISVILAIFLITSITIPFVNAEFDTNFSGLDEDNVIQDVRNDAGQIPETSAFNVSAFDVMKNIILLALFDFGDVLGLPFWLDIIYTLLAIVFILTIARNIWIGGGG